MAGLTTTLLIGAGAALAGGGLMAAMGGKKPSTPSMQMPAAPAAPKIEDASEKARLRAEERRRAMARSETVQTNPLGLKTEEATIARKKLLGG